jgi:hypothetical protein
MIGNRPISEFIRKWKGGDKLAVTPSGVRDVDGVIEHFICFLPQSMDIIADDTVMARKTDARGVFQRPRTRRNKNGLFFSGGP